MASGIVRLASYLETSIAISLRVRITSDAVTSVGTSVSVPLYGPRDAVLLRSLCRLEQCQSVAECQLGKTIHW
jgi:hypothetical protein